MDFNASKNVLCPCKGCADRFCACSSTCEKYAEWRKEYDAEKKWLQDNKYRFSTTHNKPFCAIQNLIENANSILIVKFREDVRRE